MSRRAAWFPLILLGGCLGDLAFDDDPDAAPGAPDAGPVGPVDPADDCPSMFAQSILPAYHVEIADAEWAAMEDEFLHRREREAAGLEIKPYHPIVFRYQVGDAPPLEHPGALLRLKGESSWLQAIALDPDPKMQFVIAFNELHPDGRFLGVRKIELDMPRSDQTFLRQRLGLYALRQGGIPAQCANNAQLFVNGEYYGLYTNLERLDKEFLQRNFGDDDEGDLWEGGRIIRTNEETFSWDRLEIFWHGVFDLPALDAISDLEASMLEWATEAVIGDGDGYYAGRANFYLYDHPTRGFLWMPHDLDTTLAGEFLPHDAPPVFPAGIGRHERDWTHYRLVMNDLDGLERYVDALATARGRYDVDRMEVRVVEWSAQIAAAAAADLRKPFGMDAHRIAVEQTRAYVGARARYLDDWLACRDRGGEDADGDGFDLCNDCNDHDRAIAPGLAELCNGLDDDCNGRVDDLAGGATCQ